MGGKEYADVSRSHWAYFALRRMSAAGIIKGLPNGTLGANAPLKRYDFAVALERMVAFINNDSYYFEQLQNPQAADPVWHSPKPLPFRDVLKSHRAYRAIARLWSAGVFQGEEGANFQGNRALTRYEFAAAVSRLWDLRGPFLD